MILALLFAYAFAGWEVVPLIPRCNMNCDKSDVANQVVAGGIVSRLTAMAERARQESGHVEMAFMSFSEVTLFAALCQQTRQGLRLSGFFDSKAGPPSGLAFRLENECQRRGQRNVRMYYMGMPPGGKGGWRLHHNKFFIAHYKSEEVEIAFGSANLTSTGLGVNFENWNFFSGQSSDDFVADHLCGVRSMVAARNAGKIEDDPRVFRQTLKSCLSNQSLEESGYVVMFAPDPADQVFKVLEKQIDDVVASGRIRMAAYFFTHLGIAQALQRARQRGVEIHLILDDDILLPGSIRGQRQFYLDVLQPAVSGFQVRIFDTNEEIYQMQHNKFLILEGVKEKSKVRVFAGAGQFTLSAFKNNYENFYLIENLEVVSDFQILFDTLWVNGAAAQ